MSLVDQIERVLQHMGLEKLLEWNEVTEKDIVEYLVEDGVLELPLVVGDRLHGD